ncbi:NADH-quinone oxidoreductase subunit L [Fulvivirga sedimenti]|uniref:NADH-quinone oxidoreductase subunit L n=1 Tax=Fulvivirga sedimenti TaxID=2879465 RepID=A0A9X1L233_9BACT|nr:NADH-quinone oxidoreductase subunit L [Fulvivirga sedimenti]MCA6075396.1 NADH-quinone oxidoreductase subunit L [Fulvivirga sedimenti]MCA6076573.1 NADH-quinone oxidoreductase subunit L [Fulvivirga sedimenti]MCA6077701.1 NADH-quinone oxidoreductase subunit L [Fulvivirga sedimenti]
MTPQNDALIVTLALLVALLPLTGAVMLILVSRLLKRTIPFLQTLFLFGGFLAAVSLLYLQGINPESVFHTSITWFKAGDEIFTVGLLINGAAALMAVVVTLIATLVSLYSQVYMHAASGQLRYYAMIGFFTFSMLGIVLADNLIMIFIFWELVGLASYMLINHEYKQDIANNASKKAFIVNRIGDAGFLIGIAVLWMFFGTADLQELTIRMQESELMNGTWQWSGISLPASLLTLAGVGLFMGAVGKSAQFPLQVWLPDAMAGPTPVSALIHAATMVAAGVFLLSRIFVLLGWDVFHVIAVIGSVTAFMGAVAALTQNDIKRVLAYSTISQLGYMVMGMGTGSYDAAMFHLLTHAFFKAGLFLAAGAVIYSLHQFEAQTNIHFDVQDMRQMGGLRKKMPVTFIAYLILSMALIGLPLFSGFLSKDAIITGAFAWAGESPSWKHLVPIAGLVTVALTAFYMVRQLLLVFFGEFRAGLTSYQPTDPPVLMRGILIFLALMSFGLVWSFNPFDAYSSTIFMALRPPVLAAPDIPAGFQSMLLEQTHHYHVLISVFSIGMIIVGSIIALRKFRASGPYVAGYQTMPGPADLPGRISLNNWYLNEIYAKAVVGPLLKISDVLRWLDARVIDRIIDSIAVGYVILSKVAGWFDRTIIDGFVRMVAGIARQIGQLTSGLLKGNVQYYVLVALFGVIIIICFVI